MEQPENIDVLLKLITDQFTLPSHKQDSSGDIIYMCLTIFLIRVSFDLAEEFRWSTGTIKRYSETRWPLYIDR